MVRYFFNVCAEDATSPDLVGADLPDIRFRDGPRGFGPLSAPSFIKASVGGKLT